jgi:hypothetical protein
MLIYKNEDHALFAVLKVLYVLLTENVWSVINLADSVLERKEHIKIVELVNICVSAFVIIILKL